MNRRVIASLLLVLLATAGFSRADAADRAADALLACADEQDDARRLRCFDGVVEDLRGAPLEPAAAATATTAAVVPTSPAAPVSAAEKFGARGDLKREEELSEITAKVTALGAKPYGQLIVTLDNAQVWAEIESGSKVKLKPGDEVKIERGALGSFRLIAPNGRASRVARVR